MDSKNTDRKTNTDNDKTAEGWEIITHTEGAFKIIKKKNTN